MRTRTRGQRSPDLVHSIAGWVLVPGLAVFVLFFVGRDLVPVWQATHGHGTRGAFVATVKDCSESRPTIGKTCGYYGTFTALDGSVTFEHAWLDAPPRDFAVGDTTEVVYAGGRAPRAVYREGSREWLLVVAFVVGAVVALAVWAVRLRKQLAAGRPLFH